MATYKKYKRKKKKERECLLCGKLFLSEGAHHRHCDSCRNEKLCPTTGYDDCNYEVHLISEHSRRV